MTQSGVDRRTLLKTAGLAAAGAIIAPGRSVRASPTPLARVNVSWERIIRTVVGLRPGRDDGFLVEAARFDSKTVIHNYGHGGRGVTLSWGTADLAVEQAMATGERRYAVVGCGAVGLATARLLQLRGCDVTIYSKDLPPATTSNIALGMWGPVGVSPDAPADYRAKYTRAARYAHRYFQDLVGDYYGVRWVEFYSYIGSRGAAGIRQDPFHDLYTDLQQLGPNEHPFPVPSVLRWMSLQIEPPIYLQALVRDFQLAGGRIVVRDFPDRRSLLGLAEPVIVNCTGLGAKVLFDDAKVVPVKGQLIVLLPQPEVGYMSDVRGDMVSRKDGVLLGGGRLSQPNVWTLEPDEDAKRQSMAQHIEFFGAMK